MLDFPSLLYKGLRILMFQLSGVYCRFQGFRAVRFREVGLGSLGFRGFKNSQRHTNLATEVFRNPP